MQGKCMEMKFCAYWGMGVLVVGILLVQEGGAEDATCLNRLIPCLNFLNGTGNPPDSCCNPLKWVIKSNPECLCSMISNKGSTEAEQAGINVTEAQQLPGRCGQHVNPISCLTSAPNSNGIPVPNSAPIFPSASPSMIVALALSMSAEILWAAF